MTSRLLRAGARCPLQNLQELADEFGITHGELAASLAVDTRNGLKPPAPIVQGKSKSTGMKTYFNPAEMRKWWTERQVRKEKP